MSPRNAPKYQAAVFFVKGIATSKRFYSETLGQKIVADFGRNVGFEGGLSIWEQEYALGVIFEEKAKQVTVGGNNAEIYFECADIAAFFEGLVARGIRIIHAVVEHPWGQRAFRAYDPDGHILEFAEPMSEVVLRLHREGLSEVAIAEKSLMPPQFIEAVLQAK